MKKNWKPEDDLIVSLEDFSKQLRIWNKEVFGDIFRQKAKIQNSLEGVQRNLEENASIALINCRKN